MAPVILRCRRASLLVGALLCVAHFPAAQLSAAPTRKVTFGLHETVLAPVRHGMSQLKLAFEQRGANPYQDFRTLPMRPTENPDPYRVALPAEDFAPMGEVIHFIKTMDERGNAGIHPDSKQETSHMKLKLQP